MSLLINPFAFASAPGGGGGGTYQAEVLADSPVGYWRLDDTSGTAMVDTSGNGRDGTYVNAPTLGNASLLTSGGGSAVGFNGTDERATVAHDSVFNASVGGDLTVEMWVKLTSASTETLQPLADKTNLSGANAQWQLYYDNRSTRRRLRFAVGSAANAWATWEGATTTSSLGAGGHLVARKSGTTLSLHWNGTQVASSVVSLTISASTNPLSLAGVAGFFAAGIFDEVAIYGSALSDTRIAAHYAAA